MRFPGHRTYYYVVKSRFRLSIGSISDHRVAHAYTIEDTKPAASARTLLILPPIEARCHGCTIRNHGETVCSVDFDVIMSRSGEEHAEKGNEASDGALWTRQRWKTKQVYK